METVNKHYCIFEINKVTKKYQVVDYYNDYSSADEMCKSMNNFLSPDAPVYFCVRCLEQDEFDNIQNYSPYISAIIIQSVI